MFNQEEACAVRWTGVAAQKTRTAIVSVRRGLPIPQLVQFRWWDVAPDFRLRGFAEDQFKMIGNVDSSSSNDNDHPPNAYKASNGRGSDSPHLGVSLHSHTILLCRQVLARLVRPSH